MFILTRRFVGLRPWQASGACPERLSAAKGSNGAMVAAESDEMTLPAVVKTRQSGAPRQARRPRFASVLWALTWAQDGMEGAGR